MMNEHRPVGSQGGLGGWALNQRSVALVLCLQCLSLFLEELARSPAPHTDVYRIWEQLCQGEHGGA